VARTDLGYQPTFDVNNLRNLGYYTDPVTGFRYGGAALLLNRQNYKRDELRATVGTYLTLGRSSHDLRVPKPERQKPEIEKLRSLAGGSCSDVSIRLAPRLFAEGARLTVAYGKGFGIQPGVVNLPLDIIVIPKTGTLDVTRLDTW